MNRPVRRLRRKARPFIQRTFIHWFQDRRDAFAIAVRLGRRTDRSLQLIVEGAPSALDFVLMQDGPQVFVNLNSQNWDWILWGEIIPKGVPGGYVCKLDKKPHTVYPTREAIRRAHCFEEFLTWFNTVYAASTWLACYGTNGATWARLSAQEPPDESPSGAIAVFYLSKRRQIDGATESQKKPSHSAQQRLA